jgi:uncharacterized membrane protein (UPF0127 family)
MRLDDLPSVWLEGDLRLAIADTRRARRRGLAGLGEIDPLDALLLPQCRSVHTFGMRFEIDVIFLARDGQILRLVRSLRRRRVVTCLAASAAIETVAGASGRFLAAGAATAVAASLGSQTGVSTSSTA